MPSLTPETRTMLLARLRADQAEHWRRGDRRLVEQYLADHPELADDAEAVRDLILAEADLRLERGEQPIWQEYLERFPAHAADLQPSLADAAPTGAV
jgi:hypothetical protein